MIDYATALSLLLKEAHRLPTETCALAEVTGRVLAHDVHSPIALPSFDHAAMDGYALAAETPLQAGSEHRVGGSQAAGDEPSHAHGTACEIMTGARLPEGLNAVIAVERTELLQRGADGVPQRIRLLDALAAGHNVRRAGADVATASRVLRAGTTLDAAHVMLLAALGLDQVSLVRRPRVAVIGTGKELLADAGQPLGESQIHASNGPFLAAALRGAGAQVLWCEIVDDSAVSYTAALARAVQDDVDLVISTGAVSMGRHDFVPEALRQCGAQLLFHRVGIRPGKPLLAARLSDGPLVLALPGTPMAVACGLRFFAAPLLRAMTGQRAEPVLHAVLATPQTVRPGLRHFLHASLRQHDDGRLHARVHSRQQPFRIAPFADADCWVVLPESAGDVAAGHAVQIASLHPGQAPVFHPSSNTETPG